MKVEFLSTTLIQGYPLCPARALDSYYTRLEEGNGLDGAEPTRFGSIVHAVAERVHQATLNGEPIPEPLELFSEEWQKSMASDYDYYAYGRENIEAFLDRTLYDRAGDTVGVEVKFLLNVNTGQVWVGDDVTEKRVLGILARGHVPVVSMIDRIDKVDNTTYEVYDYKSNFQPFTRWEVDNSIQLGIYDIVVRKIYKKAKDVTCVFDMVRHGRQPTSFDDTQRETLQGYLIDMWHQIDGADVAEEKINKYCRYCERRSRCSAYANILSDPTPPGFILSDDISPSEWGALFDVLDDIKNRKKILEERAKEIEQAFAVEFAQNGGHPVALDKNGEAYYSPNPRYEFDNRFVWETLKRHDALTLLIQAMNVSKTGLERVLKGRVKIKNEIMAGMSKKYVKPTLRRRKAGSTETELEESE